MRGFPAELRAGVAAWAATHDEIARVWLFGSRAKGTSGPGSDADVAVELTNPDPGEALGDWFALASEWRDELGSLLPMPLQLEYARDDTIVIMPAVREHGLLLYERSHPTN